MKDAGLPGMAFAGMTDAGLPGMAFTGMTASFRILSFTG
jgi:hypothetical protein